MKPVVVWRRARTDRREIGDFMAADNPTRARSVVPELRTRCQARGRRPMMGRPAPEMALNVRILRFRSSLILHPNLDDRISIDRVLHSARDRSIVPPYE
ncbi:type II toxin-antitoxin system RelE/ParE family toxin [Methylobacterium sp. J-026]|uniref:type II toxin-antitoxin system RelE/ParE family toxin n=1 Tax=Methylobacterium sp. J-026 TaxID=2836624 RepID=UPI001FBBB726|nr:type II toxin-antitoxin system RelE/ParE family toxin [Methylobacterium sp. J-026]MCJ2134837.1 type II toxin-antitoxin system RelE/ParE family toxin [Methylobacterium sp. J-026]